MSTLDHQMFAWMLSGEMEDFIGDHDVLDHDLEVDSFDRILIKSLRQKSQALFSEELVIRRLSIVDERKELLWKTNNRIYHMKDLDTDHLQRIKNKVIKDATWVGRCLNWITKTGDDSCLKRSGYNKEILNSLFLLKINKIIDSRV